MKVRERESESLRKPVAHFFKRKSNQGRVREDTPARTPARPPAPPARPHPRHSHARMLARSHAPKERSTPNEKQSPNKRSNPKGQVIVILLCPLFFSFSFFLVLFILIFVIIIAIAIAIIIINIIIILNDDIIIIIICFHTNSIPNHVSMNVHSTVQHPTTASWLPGEEERSRCSYPASMPKPPLHPMNGPTKSYLPALLSWQLMAQYKY